ncbi:hypothetical protein H5410_005084, partial [Solanum commersonii]
MAKSMRSKRKKRLKAIRRDIVATELTVLKKEAAKLAAQEAALAAPKLIVMSPKLMILDVIDTPGFDFSAESGLVVNEIGKCIDLADNGVHAVLFVLSVLTSFSKQECCAIQYFKKLFGTKISDYMIVVYTRGDKLEDNDSLNDHLDCSRLEDLKEALKDVWELFSTTSEKPYTSELFEEVNKMKLRNDSSEERTARLEAERKIRELKDNFEQLLTYTVWIATRYSAGSMNKLLSHRRSTKKGNFVLELCKIADIYYVDCNEVLRWKYEQVVEPSQKYKEGKFALALCKIVDLYCVDCNE